MKKLIQLLTITTLTAMALAVPLVAGDACSGCDMHSAPEKQIAGQTQKYTCPMHPEVTSDKPGKCPKCGMTLEPVKKADAKKQG